MFIRLTLSSQLVITLFVFLAVVFLRLHYVNSFAVALPFWDQWDAEGDFLLRPWIENRLKFSALLEPHNEHRIFPTRILSLVIFQITGEWNNLTEAKVNVFLAAAVAVIVTWVLLKTNSLFGARWLVLPAILAQFVLPFPFENLLVGFQSQFYFLMLFTLTSLLLATYRPGKIYAVVLIIFLCCLSIVTMASGLLTPVAVAIVYLWKMFLDSKTSIRESMLVLIFLLLGVAGYLLIRRLPVNEAFHAQNASELLDSLGYILSWPFVHKQFYSVFFWSPALIMIGYLSFSRTTKRNDIFMLGCFVWSFLQALAIAYGRGHDLTEVSSRYTELFSLGLIANAWFAARAVEELGKTRFRFLPFTFFLIFFYGHFKHIKRDQNDIGRNYKNSLLQTRNVCNYLKTNDKRYLQQPQFEIPFPDPVRLQYLLDQPAIRGILPDPMRKIINDKRKAY